MGKKTPPAAPTTLVAKTTIPSKKAKAPTTAADNAQAAEHANLTEASALLDSVSVDVLKALVKAKSGPVVISDSDDDNIDVRPKSREQLSTLRTDIQGIDTIMMQTLADQNEQFLDGTLLIVESLMEAVERAPTRKKFMAEALAILHRRTKCMMVSLKAAGPVAGGSFAATYELWHAKRRHFVKSDFKPEEVEKAEVEAAISREKHSAPRGPARSGYQHGQDRARTRPQSNYRSQKPYNKSRQSPKDSQRDRSRSRSPAKRR